MLQLQDGVDLIKQGKVKMVQPTELKGLMEAGYQVSTRHRANWTSVLQKLVEITAAEMHSCNKLYLISLVFPFLDVEAAVSSSPGGLDS